MPPLRSPKWGPPAPTAPMGRALRPSTPGDFPVAGKVTKGAPRAAPFGIPRCVVAALFALAALRSVSRRATFCHKNRPICHFKLVGKSVFFSPQATPGVTLSAVNLWRGSCFVACVLPGVAPLSGGSSAPRCWGDDNAPQGEYPEGVTPSGRFFGDFLIGEKVTRGRRGGAPSPGECRGAQPLAKRPRGPHPSAER